MEILSKITPYNLFNFLFPGAIFCELLRRTIEIDLAGSSLVEQLFVYYLAGMAISRIGSIFVEPFLRWTGFVTFADYGDYLTAEKDDEKLKELVSVNNSFRTLIALFVLLGLVVGCVRVMRHYEISDMVQVGALVSALFVLFLAAYRKQTSYISKRVNHRVNKK